MAHILFLANSIPEFVLVLLLKEVYVFVSDIDCMDSMTPRQSYKQVSACVCCVTFEAVKP